MVEHLMMNNDGQGEEDQITTEEQDRIQLINQYGLWTYSMLEDWNTAVTYAEKLYNKTMSSDTAQLSSSSSSSAATSSSFSDSSFSTDFEQLLLKQYAIQAFVNNKLKQPNISRAMEFLLEVMTAPPVGGCGGTMIMTTTINSVLRCQIRIGRYVDAKTLFDKILQQQQSPLLDEQSYRLALECATKLGDIPFLDRISKLILEGDEKLSTTISNPSLFKMELPSKTLQTFAKASSKTGMFLSPEQEQQASQCIQLLLNEQQKREQRSFMPVISEILLSFNNTSDELKVVVDVCRQQMKPQQQQQQQQQKASSSWHSSLSVPAKVKILPSLVSLEGNVTVVEFEGKRTKVVNNPPPRGDDIVTTTDSWDVLTSLVTTITNSRDGTVAVSQESRDFLRRLKSAEFFLVSLFLLNQVTTKERQAMIQSILEEGWETILSTDVSSDADILQRAGALFTDIPILPEKGTRNKLFTNIMIALRKLPMFSTPIIDIIESEGLVFEDNDKLTFIVNETVWLLRAMMACTKANNNIADNDSLVTLASDIVQAAIQVIGELDDFSSERRPSDNGAKEALSVIMKEFLQSNLVEGDCDIRLVQLACQYYYSLMRVARSSSKIQYKEFLFPPYSLVSHFTTIITKSQDPFKFFRSLIVEDIQLMIKKPTGNWHIDAVRKLFPEEDGYGENHVTSLLLPTIMLMIRQSDSQIAGANSYKEFVSRYISYFTVWRRDLFFDRELFNNLFDALEFASYHMKGRLTVPPGEEGKEAYIDNNWFDSLWSLDLQKLLIRQLSTRQVAHDQIVRGMNGKEWEHIAQVSAQYLLSLYAQEMKFDESLRNEYINACSINCEYLVNFLTSKSVAARAKKESTKKIKIAGRREQQWLSVFWVMFCSIASHKKYVPKDYEHLIYHILNSFVNSWPGKKGDAHDRCGEAILHSKKFYIKKYKALDPKIEKPMRQWYETVVVRNRRSNW